MSHYQEGGGEREGPAASENTPPFNAKSMEEVCVCIHMCAYIHTCTAAYATSLLQLYVIMNYEFIVLQMSELSDLI